MKFYVSRTSIGCWRPKEKQPCVEAQKVESGWIIELTTLEELLAFADKYGELIISSPDASENTAFMEIYDDYRE